ncbi:MAG TPA: RAMP superfamily CRISPR-associated protein [Thermoanaerobaculia bacterium]|jgi:CRISPR/Cas system CSM-associated protein Csm3 (group 7 of RAMP superfamily)|nr:RAMP superfamily CRISPR-associated protein [Thermoanaerobaculia bacterium]
MPRLRIALTGPLLIAGGQSSPHGVDLATAQRFDGTGWTPYIPATALRGAVRIQLETLLAGARRPVVGPYVLEEAPGRRAEDHKDNPVARLFGFSGPKGRRNGAHEGCLRFGDALPADADRARRALRVRPGVELDDATAAAADQKLFFREVAEISAEPLLFEAVLDTGKAREDDLDLLRAAVETTDALGAGKSKGGGAVAIEWIDGEPREAGAVHGDAAAATRAKLLFTLHEPANFGDGGPQGNHQGTRSYVPGATVRGAVAWALVRAGVDPEGEGFQRLFVREPARFGDALPVPEPTADPAVRPATERELRGAKTVHDVLAAELARDRVNARLAGSGLYLRTDDGDQRFDPAPARPVYDVVRRTRTRVSIDRATGTAADGRLFSIEQIEPWRAGSPPRRTLFAAWVEGLEKEGAALLHRAADLPVLLGAGRNHGMGRAELTVYFATDPDPAGAAAHVHALAARIETLAAGLAARAGLAWTASGAATVPVALVAQSDYVPTDAAAPHPLAEPEMAVLAGTEAAEGPVRRYLHTAATGGYDQRHAGSLRDLVTGPGAGSVYIYEINAGALTEWLRDALPRLRRGVGRQTEHGCGRFTLFEQRAEE